MFSYSEFENIDILEIPQEFIWQIIIKTHILHSKVLIFFLPQTQIRQRAAGPLVQTDFNLHFRDIKYLKTMELHHNF